MFCAGVGEDTPDIANASRKIKDSEIETCKTNGVTAITEVPIGYDGIVLANSKQHGRYELTVKDVWLALAKEVPVDGKLVANPYKTWKDVNPALAADKIEVLGPAADLRHPRRLRRTGDGQGLQGRGRNRGDHRRQGKEGRLRLRSVKTVPISMPAKTTT